MNYKGVTLHRQSGLWRATVYVNGGSRSIGYHKTPEQAARAVDYVRVDDYGRPPINFPDSVDETLSAPHPDSLRMHAGPRGIKARILEELRCDDLTKAELAAALRGLTTKGYVRLAIFQLVAEGHVRRVGWAGKEAVFAAVDG